ncbi:Tetratricopeptide repeat [Trypanosoma brucei equiperdum]|uniref:Tetratricopeptide repeat n=1 Tax=Trypanosoma brucei equiperdum TaxID=630700 RepID=A0A3L6L9V9_9TRYP|nr:Tetratricopeptide repeat [Trypanosoma brucei equiperdum]
MHDGSQQDASHGATAVNSGVVPDGQWRVDENIIIREILAMNTLAMQRCDTGALDESSSILTDAYMKLHNDTSTGESQGLDAVRATTLNNLGVVECHRGQHRQALSHFEAARQLEEAWSAASPSVALNSCAAYNALGMYDKATAAAMETINMLRRLFAQQEFRGSPTGEVASTPGGSCGAQPQSDGMNVASSDNAALWGAAWHNLAVAQINTAKSSTDLSEYTNAAALFQNAMRATQELLGYDHPMTKSVTETYRAVRNALRTHGVYKQHHTLFTAPLRPADPRDEADDMEQYFKQCGIKSRRRALEKYYRDLTITFCGAVTNGVKLTERLDPTPYPLAKDVSFRRSGQKDSLRMLRAIPTGSTIEKACHLYGNPHPLLFSLPPEYRASEVGTAKSIPKAASANSFAKVPMKPNALASSRRPQPKREQIFNEGQRRMQIQSNMPKQQQRQIGPPSTVVNYSRALQETPGAAPTIPQITPLSYKASIDEHWQPPVNQTPAPVNYNWSVQQQAPNTVPTAPLVYQQTPVNQGQAPLNHNWSAQQQAPNVVPTAPLVYQQAPVDQTPAPVNHNRAVQQQAPNTVPTAPLVYQQTPVSQGQAPAVASQPPLNQMPNVSQGESFDHQQGMSGRQEPLRQQEQEMLASCRRQAPAGLGQGAAADHRSHQESVSNNTLVVGGQEEKKKKDHVQPVPAAPAAVPAGPAVSEASKPAAAVRGPLPPLKSPPGGRVIAKAETSDGVEGIVSAPRKASSGGQTATYDARRAYEQIKYILLADPPAEASRRKSKQDRSKKDSVPANVPQQECGPWTDNAAPAAGESPTEHKPHRLFDALWVSGGGPADQAPLRVVGKPSYFVSSVLDMRQGQAEFPEEVMQMVAENSRSSCSDVEERHSQTMGPAQHSCTDAGIPTQDQS